jgi:hypothetical protein
MNLSLGDMDILGAGEIILSDVDILGDDSALVMESLGGLNQQQAQNIARQMAAARQIDPKAVLVRQQLMRRMGVQGAGSSTVLVTLAAPVQQVSLAVSRPFKPTEIIIPSNIAPFFQINSIQVNGVNQLASNGPVPCQTLSEASFRPKMKIDTVNPSFPLTLEVQLINSLIDRTFSSLFVGWALLK